MATKIFESALFQDEEPQIGQTYYAVRLQWNNGNEKPRTDFHHKPQRKNRSGEECVEGWLGETNNINAEAIGKWKIIKILGKGKHWTASYKIEAEKIVN